MVTLEEEGDFLSIIELVKIKIGTEYILGIWILC
jgi:hypothetical protein